MQYDIVPNKRIDPATGKITCDTVQLRMNNGVHYDVISLPKALELIRTEVSEMITKLFGKEMEDVVSKSTD